jgi:adenine-specific DNA-methyltransferase
MKRADCRVYASPFNRKDRIRVALEELVRELSAKWLVVSFNDEGYVSPDEMIAILSRVGEVRATGHDFKRYVGAQIGIYNPRGQKVGAVSHLENQEWLFVVDKR